MKVGIIGLPQTGKKTLFKVLTGMEPGDQPKGAQPVQGMAEIIDSRFDNLVDMYNPKKEVRARINLALLPDLEKAAISRGDVFRDIADTDAVCHVLRCFEDDAVYHPDGSVDPLRDLDTINSELILHDQIFAEKRIERIEELLKKKKDKDQAAELELMKRMKAHLELEKPLRLMEISENEALMIKSYPFITLKEMILALNVSEDRLGDKSYLETFGDRLESDRMEAMTVSAKVESEIVSLDSQAEKEAFFRELGIEETALETLTRLCLRALGLISFFTVGEDEVRQWLVRKSAGAARAAGVIHSDMERGFIRAEVMKYAELISYKTEAALKKAGKMNIEGKDYTVEDGDILNIRFNV